MVNISYKCAVQKINRATFEDILAGFQIYLATLLRPEKVNNSLKCQGRLKYMVDQIKLEFNDSSLINVYDLIHIRICKVKLLFM